MNAEKAERARQERLTARAAKYHTQVERLRTLAGLTPEPSPAPGIPAPESADVSAFERPGDVQQRAGEPDRPETACAAPGCFRPTADGICDRCRAAAAAEDVQAANAELIERLHANERERARTRPEPDPDAPAPRFFTSADYDPERVHAAQARAAEQRTTPHADQPREGANQ